MKITKRKYITTITYDKICNGVKNSCRESFFDKKYVDIRVDEINNCEYDKEYKIDQNTLFLDFIDIYLKKVSLKKDTYKKYEFYVSLTRRYIMDYFEDIYIKDITQTFIENLSIQVNNQVSKYGNKEKVISKTLKNDIKAIDDEDIDTATIADYLNILDRLFITDNQKPFSTKIRSSVRIKQSEKRHFCDPSLACALLNITPNMLLNDLETLGFLFESLCERDLKIYAESIDAHIYHYQDYKEREIDTIIELNDGRWCAVEIKLGANQIESAAENLKKIYKEMEQDPKSILPSAMIIICGLSNAAYQREDGIYVVPLTALKD